MILISIAQSPACWYWQWHPEQSDDTSSMPPNEDGGNLVHYSFKKKVLTAPAYLTFLAFTFHVWTSFLFPLTLVLPVWVKLCSQGPCWSWIANTYCLFLHTARWGAWTAWSPCMKTCGTGVSLRSRECLTGANCRGSGTETKKCKIQDCPCKWRSTKQSTTWYVCLGDNLEFREQLRDALIWAFYSCWQNIEFWRNRASIFSFFFLRLGDGIVRWILIRPKMSR